MFTMEAIMPTPTSITLVENANNHVFQPLNISAVKSVLATVVAASPIGDKRLELGFDLSSKKRPTDRASVKLTFPKLLGDSSVGYTVKDTAIMDVSIVVPEAFSAADRTVFADLCGAALSDAIVKGYFKRDPLWG
jgi:hypothetical protein